MGKGKKWQGREAEDLARSYIAATCDPIVGRDQTSHSFHQKIYDGFIQRAPPKVDSEMYGGRSFQAVIDYLKKKIQKDVCKFNSSLRLVRASKPTGGVNDQQIVNMAVSCFLGKTKGMDYNFKDFPANNWVNYKAWLVLRTMPKFNPDFAGGADNSSMLLPPAAPGKYTSTPVSHSSSSSSHAHLLFLLSTLSRLEFRR